MKEKLGPTTEFAWDKNWSIEWNVPREVTIKGGKEKTIHYDHNLVIGFDLRDPERPHLKRIIGRLQSLPTKK